MGGGVGDGFTFAVGAGDGVTAGSAKAEAEPEISDPRIYKMKYGLQQALLKRSELFVSTVTEKLMTYALGRGVEYYDAPAVRAIVRDTRPNDYRFSAIILGIVNSNPFQMRRTQ